MNKRYLCAAAVVALSAVSFPAAAWMFGATYPGNILESSSLASPAPALPTARGPDGQAVRVISFNESSSPSITPADAPLEAAVPLSSALSSAQLPAVAVEPRGEIRQIMHAKPKRVAHGAAGHKPMRASLVVAAGTLY